MKKFFITLLLFLCTYVFIGCHGKDYSLEINVVEKVYVGDSSNYEVTLLPDNTKLTEYEYSSSDDDILEVNKNTVTGVSNGSAKIIIKATIDSKEVVGEVNVTVEKKEEVVNYELEITGSEKYFVGDTFNLEIKEKTTNSVISEYNLFSNNEEVLKVENNKLIALKAGTVKVNVSCTYKDVQLTGSIDITIEVKKYGVTFIGKDIYGNDNYVLHFDIIEEGKEAMAPTLPIVPGFEFVGWDKPFDNVTSDLEVHAIYKEIPMKEANIKTNIGDKIYVNQLIEVEVFDLDDNQITDFELIVENEDVLFYEDGLLEPFDVGVSEVTIKAYVNGILEEYTFTLEVLEGYTLSIEVEQSLTEGETVTFKPIINPGNIELKEFKATTSNNNIFKIKGNDVTALLKGSAVLSINGVYEGISLRASVTINVKKYVKTSLSLSINEYLFLNESKDLEVILKPYNTKIEEFEVSIDDAYKAIIKYENGKIVPLALGEAAINIKTNVNGENLNETFNVEVYEFNGIKLEIPEKLTLNEVASYKVYAIPSNVELVDHIIQSNNDVILLNQSTIFASETGSASLSVKYTYGNKEYSASANVVSEEKIIKVERLYIDCSAGALEGNTLDMIVTTYPKVSNYELVYSSSDETVAKVDANGKIIALKAGKVIIKVSLKDNENVYSIHNLTVITKKDTSVVSGSIDGVEYQGRYYEESVKHYYELINGITETSYVAYTSTKTAGIDVDGYTGITGTIEVDKFYPQNVHVFDIPSQKNTKIVPWANLNNDKWTLTSVKGLINDYEAKNPGSKVICAINGDFFDINANGNLPYQTTGENVSDGEFYKTSNGHGVGVGGTLGFTNDGSNLTLVSGSHAERTPYMVLAIYDDNNNIVKELKVETLNSAPAEGQTSVYFGTYNSDKTYVPSEFTVETNTYIIETAEKALPNNENDFYGLGTISKLGSNEEVITLEKGSFAIVSRNEEVNNTLNKDVKIRVQYEFTGKFENVQSATGYNRVIYEDINQLPPYIADRAPRTCIGMKEDGSLIMMVIDGRQGGDDMYGADGTELAAIMSAYGCINAYNLDGGGSSTIVVRDETGLVVLNTPSDGRERNDGNCILIVTEDPNYTVETNEITTSSAKLTINTNTESFKDYIPCIKLDGVIYESVNNVVTLNNLVHNTEYNYKVVYKKPNEDIYYETLTTGSFITCKTGFKFLGITLAESSDEFVFTVYAEDIDNSSNIFTMEAEVDGQVTFFKDGVLTLKKSIFGEYINEIKFKYRYTDNNETKDVVLEKTEWFIK